MSVFLTDPAHQTDDAKDALLDHPDFGVIAITAAVARSLGLGIQKDPIPKHLNHALVFGPIPKSVQRRLADAADWAIRPSGASPEIER